MPARLPAKKEVVLLLVCLHNTIRGPRPWRRRGLTSSPPDFRTTPIALNEGWELMPYDPNDEAVSLRQVRLRTNAGLRADEIEPKNRLHKRSLGCYHLRMIAPIQPFLRWAGSKRQLVPRLASYWPGDSTRYFEPFAGSACFFFAIQPKEAILGDINADLIRTYCTVRDHPSLVAAELEQIAVNKDTYYRLRHVCPEAMSTTAAAARFIYLNRFCFNGLYRTNAAGAFNVPFASSGTGKLPSLSHLQDCAELLMRAQLRCNDFEATLQLVQQGDFVYLDPPYAVSTRRVFREYSATPFSQSDLFRLSRHLNRIDSLGARFLVSYADCTEAREAFRPWHITRVRTRRNIAGFAVHRSYAFELIVTNMNEEKR